MESFSNDDTTPVGVLPQASSEITSQVGGDDDGAGGGGGEEEAEDEEDGATVIQNNNGVMSDGMNGTNSNTLMITATPTLDELIHHNNLREMGREAICWQLSSAKPGNGVEQIRDWSMETYWQSDVPTPTQPHWIQVHFARRVAISYVCLHLDFNLDESYTPKKVKVEVGMTSQDLISAIPPPHTEVEFTEPVGWCIIPLRAPPDPLDDYDDDEEGDNQQLNVDDDDMDETMMGRQQLHRNHNGTISGMTQFRNLVRAHLLRISVLSMHQNGRDTHVRHVQIFGPRMMNVTNLLPPTLPINSRMPLMHKKQQQLSLSPNTPHDDFHEAMEGVVVEQSQENNEEEEADWIEERRSLQEDFAALRMKWFPSIR